MLDPIRNPGLVRLRLLWNRLKAKFVRAPSGQKEADRQLSAFYERVWRDAAKLIGATVLDLGNNVLEIRRGDRRTRVWHNVSAIDDQVTHRIVRTKGLMYRLLTAQKLPVPRHLEFSVEDIQPAAAFMESTSRPCVIKPASGTGGGLGVATDIRTRWQLVLAAWTAARSGDHLIIEDKVEGHNYRLLYLDGELLDVVKREAPSVRADGKSTVGQLLERLNQDRLRQQGTLSHSQLRVDMDMHATLRRQGLVLGSVPSSDTLVRLKTVINDNSSQENVSARAELCPDILHEAAQAAQLSGLRLSGVDIITKDPGRSLRESGGVILEVNSPPGFFWHYHKRDGSFPVALFVLRALFDQTTEPSRHGTDPVSAVYAPASGK